MVGPVYDLVEDDDLLAPLFGGKVRDQHRRDVVTWWCEVMGGPAAYTDHLGGYEHMLSKHRGLHITSQQRLRFVTCSRLPLIPQACRQILSFGQR